MPSGPKCTICLEPAFFAERVRPGACRHAFHYLCLSKWAAVNNHCPLCNQRFTKIVGQAGLLCVHVPDAKPEFESDGEEVFFDSDLESSSSEEEEEDEEYWPSGDEGDFESCESETSMSGWEDDDSTDARIPEQEIEILETNALSVLGGGACVDKPQSSIGKALLRHKGRRTRARTRDKLTVYTEYADGRRELLATFPGTDVTRAMACICAIRRAEAQEEDWELVPITSCEPRPAAPSSGAVWEYAPKSSATCASSARRVLRYAIILNE